MRRSATSSFGLLCLFALLLAGCSGQKAPPKQDEAAKTVDLRLTSEPSGAAVLVAGRDRIGKTPTTLRRHEGDRLRLHFAKDGYKPAIRDVFVENRNEQRVHVKLQRESGTIIVNTGLIRGAKVLLDGKYRGRSPLRIEATVGEHLVRVEKAGAAPFEKRVRIEKSGHQLPLSVRLAPQTTKRKKKK